MRLIFKPELLERVGLSYTTIWVMMREGRFPRSRVIGGKHSEGGQNQKVAWLSDEVEAWQKRDPIIRLQRFLNERKLWDDTREQTLQAHAKQEASA